MIKKGIITIALFLLIHVSGTKAWASHAFLNWANQKVVQTISEMNFTQIRALSAVSFLFAASCAATYYLAKQEKMEQKRINDLLKDFSPDKIIVAEFNESTEKKEFAELFMTMFSGLPLITSNTHILIARYKERIVGFAVCSLKKSIGEIEFLGVAPEFRKRGFAKKLLERAVAYFKKNGAKKVKANVRPENTVMHSLCAGLGLKGKDISSFTHYSVKFGGVK